MHVHEHTTYLCIIYNMNACVQENDSQLNKECVKLRKQITELKKQHQVIILSIAIPIKYIDCVQLVDIDLYFCISNS